eukprot:CAMPEP_0184297104 /NCGR_PEP_ID=MMETSP1049-20130417/8044_1 /TAXON_ID=77928 /ORGANISM="Proteomonas sulcata, Strain CCMP704" /LENGTH=59 /DNA_ID=CAMNT_0026606677 /DNA_START=627 /DNA_END=806 /DNA_ORIENTATION=+
MLSGLALTALGLGSAPQSPNAVFTKQDTRTQDVCVGSTCIHAENIEVLPQARVERVAFI